MSDRAYIDVEAELRAFLANATLIRALAGKFVVAASDLQLPEGYDVARSPGLVFAVRGGNPNAHAPIVTPFVQVRCYAADARTAWRLDRALVASLHGKKFGHIKMALQSAQGQLVKEADAKWPYVFSTYRLTTALHT